MSLEYIVHRPGCQGDRLIDKKIAGVMKDPLAQICVITPARSTFQTQERLVRASGRGGHLGLQVISPAKLTHEVVSGAYGAALETLPEFGKAALIQQIIRANREQLPTFGQYDTIDFAALTADMLDKLHAAGVRAADVRRYADESGSKHAMDLALVWEEYDAARTGRMDDWDRMDIAIEHLAESQLLDDMALVVVRGFDTFTEEEMRLLRAVIDAAPRVLLSVYGGDPSSDADLFADAERASRELIDYARGKGIDVEELEDTPEEDIPADIEYAAQHVFAPYTAAGWDGPVPSIRVQRASSKEEEVRAAADEIARLHLDEDVPFGQFAVVYGEDKEYASIVERVFSEANIPHFASKLVDPAGTSIGAAMLAAAAMSFGPTTIEDLMDYYVGTARNAGMIATRRGQLEEAAHGRNSLAEILASEELKAETRDAIEREFAGLWNHFREMDEADAGAVFGAVSRFLKSKWKALGEPLKNRTDDPDLFASIEMNWVQGFAVMDRLKQQWANVSINAEQAREILASALHASRIVTVPQGADEVQVGRLGAIEIPEVHTLFLVGMNDEILPRFAEPAGGVLSRAEFDDIIARTGRPPLRTREMQQKFDVVSAMRQSRHTLWCSYDTSGGLKPSVVIDRLLNKLFAGSLKEEVINPDAFALQENACDQALRTTSADSPISQILQEPAFESRRAMAEIIRRGIAKPETVPDGAPVPASASALIQYNECPYKYYLNYGLHVKDIQGSQDAINAGNYMHDVMELLGGKIQNSAGDARWSDIPDDDFDQLLEESLREAAGDKKHQKAYKDTAADLAVVQDRLRVAVRAIRDIRSEEHLFAPYAFELKFDSADGTYSGRIDRIDKAELAGETYYFVIDYKISGKKYQHASVAAGGDSIQLIFYAMALHELMKQNRLPKGRLAGAGFIQGLADLNAADRQTMGEAQGFVSVEQRARELFGTQASGNRTRISTLASTWWSKADKKKGKPERIDGRTTQGRALAVGGEPADALLDLQTAVEYVRKLLCESRDKISRGDIRICPAHSASKDHDEVTEELRIKSQLPEGCSYCGYGSICRFDLSQPRADVWITPSSAVEAAKYIQDWAPHREESEHGED